jgi:tol-pal system protein YbgF
VNKPAVRREQFAFATSLVTASWLLLTLSQSGCMLATQKDMLQLDENQHKSQADLITKMNDLSSNLETLNSQLESSQQRMTVLSQKLDDLQADLQRRFNVLSGQVTGNTGQGPATPGDMYKLAYNDYQAGKYDLAIVGFRNILSQYPHAELAAQAQYNIGECEFARKNYQDAAREFERTVQLYPKSEFAPKALYKKGVALQQAGRKTDAREAFRRLVKEFPHHELAKSARDILSE